MYQKMNLKTRRTEIKKKLYIMHHSKRKKILNDNYVTMRKVSLGYGTIISSPNFF